MVILPGCRDNDPSIVARVGSYILTEEELSRAADPNQYLSHWIEDRLLAFEAERRGIDRMQSVADELRKVRVKLLVDGLMYSELESMEPPSTREIEDYYLEHEEEFLRAESEMEIFCIVGMDESELLKARRQLRIGISPEKVINKYPGLTFLRDIVTDPAGLLPPFNSLADENIGEIVGPVSAGERFYLFKIENIFVPGTLKPLSSVRDEIEYRIASNNRFKLREKLLKGLEEKYNPQLNMKLLNALGLIPEEER